MKVVATVAFAMGLDKRDVGAVSLILYFIFALVCMMTHFSHCALVAR